MFVSVANYTPLPAWSRIAHVLYMIPVFALLCAGRLDAQTVATYSFEDGTADGWTSFNGASTPVATNAAAYSGSYSSAHDDGLGRRGRPSIASEHDSSGRGQVHHHRLC